MKALLLVALAVTMAVPATIGQVQPERSVSPGLQARTPTALQYLNQRIDDVTFEEAPFDQVIDWLNTITPLQIEPRWPALEDRGIDRDKPISLQLKNLRLSQVLYMVMNAASGPDVVLAYRASGNLLILSTNEDLERELLTRVYDVSDLLLRAPSFSNAPMMDLSSQEGSSQGGSSGGGQNIFGGQGGNSGDEDRGEDDDTNIEELKELIRNTIYPDSWQENGGRGSIHHFGKLLVVRNSPLVHQALGEYVEERD